MAARYSIIQFVPDPITGERINIGVAAFDERRVLVRFLTKWDRVRHFADRDIDFLKEFASWMKKLTLAKTVLPTLQDAHGPLDQDQVIYMSERWMNTIQLSEPRASVTSVDELLLYASARFLAETVRRKKVFRDRQDAARTVVSQVRIALAQKIGNQAEELVKKRFPLQGRFQGHKFDAVVTNGVPYFAAHGISFEGPEAKGLENVLDALAWAVADVKAQDPSLPLAVATLPPTDDAKHSAKLQDLYERSLSIYREIGAEVLNEDQVQDWASRIASRIL
jgi:hypothetical protein